MDGRNFIFGDKTISYDSLPVFPLVCLNAVPDDAAYEKLPVIKSFREKLSDNLAASAEITAQFALAGERLHLRVVCRTFSHDEVPMRDFYDDWVFDNSIEFFIGNGEKIYQFQLNAKGGNVLFVNRHVTPMPAGCRTSGQLAPGYWHVDFSIPADTVLCEGEAIFKIAAIDISSILGPQYYWTLNNPFDGYGLLKTGAKEADPVYAGEGAYEPDWNMFRKMALSAYRVCKLPLPQLAEPSAIRGALHDVLPLIRPVSNEIPEVDFGCRNGVIRPLSGTNFGPKITTQSHFDWNEIYRKIGFSSVRLHDIPLSEPGSRMVDTTFVFPLSKADPANPDNYYFKQTDYYFENIMSVGGDIYYRLGVSIDHGKKRFVALMPHDFEHYAEVCAGIVRHYNHGWANGHHWNIKYWEIWNEPESIEMWNGTFDDYLDLFVTVFKRLKSEFPEIKVGGFSAMSLNIQLFRKMAQRCAEAGIVPDFISWHHYSANMDGMIFQPFAARFMADAIGFENAELHLTEWHYIGIGPGTEAGYNDMGGIDSAAWTAGVIMNWQDSPLDLSHFYHAGFGPYGIFGNYRELKKVYYALSGCGELQTRYNRRVRNSAVLSGTGLLGGKDKDGNGMVLYSCFKNSDDSVKLVVKGIPDNAEIYVYILDEQNDMKSIEYKRNGDLFEMKKSSGSAIFKIEFKII